jgi:hypothetical protein
MVRKFDKLLKEKSSWLVYREKVVACSDCIKIACMSLRNDDLEQTITLLSDIYSKAGDLIFSENIPEEKDNHKSKPPALPNLDITSTLLVIFKALHSKTD